MNDITESEKQVSTDEELYEKYITSGDKESFRDLFMRHNTSLTLFIFGYVRNMHDAEDIMMDTFAAAAAGETRFAGRSSFRTWLFGIAHNLACKSLRKKRRLMLFRFDEGDEPSAELPDDNMLKSEKNIMIFEALSKLPSDKRDVLYLYYFEQMDHNEIAAVMKKSKKQIYNLLSRAKEALRAELEGSGFENGQL